ncbi:hypothetical protein Vafri_12755 [Volvox africanus]|uniref:Uncharacterized protein n=1 Tax=Volvox africanus TaxID=51714 RepID=A0A8J4BAL1_9CHLO|nr:hypothetical protein Vafri_12755 [Volvox africanus]
MAPARSGSVIAPPAVRAIDDSVDDESCPQAASPGALNATERGPTTAPFRATTSRVGVCALRAAGDECAGVLPRASRVSVGPSASAAAGASAASPSFSGGSPLAARHHSSGP